MKSLAIFLSLASPKNMFIDYLLIYFFLTGGLPAPALFFFLLGWEYCRERQRQQTSIGCLSYAPQPGTSHMRPHQGPNHNPGLCSEWEIEPKTFGFVDDALSELHQPGRVSEFKSDQFTSRIWNLASDFYILSSRLSANMSPAIPPIPINACQPLPWKGGVCIPSSWTLAGPGLTLTHRTLRKWCCMTSGLCSFISLSWSSHHETLTSLLKERKLHEERERETYLGPNHSSHPSWGVSDVILHVPAPAEPLAEHPTSDSRQLQVRAAQWRPASPWNLGT